MSEKSVDGWVEVFTTGTDYEAELVRDRLADQGLNAVVLAHRDHAFNLTVGDLSTTRVLVPPSQADEARRILQSVPLSDQDLDDAALSSDPNLDDDDSE